MEEQYKWSFNDFFLNDNDFLHAFSLLKKEVKILKSKLQSLSLEEKLKVYYEQSLKCEKLLTYAELNSDLDLKNENYLAYKNEVYIEKKNLEEIKNEIDQEIMSLEVSLEKLLKQNPNLKKFYMHIYNVLRMKKHSINNSAVVNGNLMIQRVNSLYNTIMKVELPAEEAEINENLMKINGRVYNQYIRNQDGKLRQLVFKTFMKTLKNVNQSVASLYNMRYELCFDIAKEKGYKSILEQIIVEDDLDYKIIENLISSVHENLSILNRYIELKKKKRNIEEFHFYDLNVNSDYNPKYTFTEGIEIVKESLNELGETYKSILNQVLNGGMIDAFSSNNKFGGGYHWRNYTKPMILMNYKNNFREVATIGHELGHAVNGILVRDHQDFQNFHFSIFLSEIASTVNEDRVEEYMYKKASPENKIEHLEQIIDKFITSIFYQTMLLEFQMTICNKIELGEYVKPEEINQTFLSLFKNYYSSIHIDEELKYLWQTIIHMFYDVHKYYNFQYAIGKIVALVINENINNGQIEKYLKYLTIGGSMPTLKALEIAGVDLTQKDIYENAFQYLNHLLDEYETLI